MRSLGPTTTRASARLAPACAYLAVLATLFLSSGCGTGMLNPGGPAAARIARLWWVLFGVCFAIALFAFAMLLLALRRRRRGDDAPEGIGRRLVLWAGLVMPTVVVIGFMTDTILTFKAVDSPQGAVVDRVAVEAHDWWWHFEYPGQEFATANEIHIPLGEPVEVAVHSHDVIHSFWVAALQGKIDALPRGAGHGAATTWLQADKPGAYRGVCAEFCGLQHAKMQFLVIAEEREAYDRWVAGQSAPAVIDPGDEAAVRGLEAYAAAGCGGCHDVRGAQPGGDLGPDLTHVATRRELGAGTLPNTPGDLALWVAHSQTVKPGNLMPSFDRLPPEQLQDILVFLSRLR